MNQSNNTYHMALYQPMKYDLSHGSRPANEIRVKLNLRPDGKMEEFMVRNKTAPEESALLNLYITVTIT
uniref:Uncharacterized protein n=1 Tax=Arion vulgaris TaxID=1028688 RepID=A0A0B6ZMH0_9EUPU